MNLLRSHGLFVALMLLIVPIYVVWSWSDQLGSSGGDSAYYMMTAQAYAPWAQHDELFAQVAAASRFPPLYPLWLAITGGARDLVAAHFATTAVFFVALGAIYAWLIQGGATRALAVGVTLLIALLPQSLMLGLWPQSEYPYLALSVIALIAIGQYRMRPTLANGLVCAVVVAAAALTRSIGIALLPALALTLLTGPRPRHAWLALLAAAPFAMWSLLHHSRGGYGDILAFAYGRDAFGALWHQLASQPQLLRYGFAGNFLQTTGLVGIVSGPAALALLALVARLFRLEADAVYCASYLVIVAIWPFPEEIARLLWPIVPILVGGLVLEASRAGARISALTSHFAAGVIIAALILVTLPTDAFIADRWATAADQPAQFKRLPEWYFLDPRRAVDLTRMHLAMVQVMRRLSQTTPADDCVIGIKPELVEYFGHRRSAIPPEEFVGDDLFLPTLRAKHCSYLLMISGSDPTFPVPMHPFRRIFRDIDIIDREALFNDDRPNDYLVAIVGKLRSAPNPSALPGP